MGNHRVKKIGVLGVQGGVIEHMQILSQLESVEAVWVRRAEDLMGLSGIILPGGESTAIGRILQRTGLLEALQNAIDQGLAVFGTCAGMILLSRSNNGNRIGCLERLDIEVERNAFGRQLDSFDHEGMIEKISTDPLKMRFVRAPRVKSILSKEVDVLYSFEGFPVAVLQGKMMATAFHPELVGETRFHQYFVEVLAL